MHILGIALALLLVIFTVYLLSVRLDDSGGLLQNPNISGPITAFCIILAPIIGGPPFIFFTIGVLAYGLFSVLCGPNK